MPTPAYCKHCNINWAAIATQDDDSRDETYEFCPVCKNDMDLTDPIDGDRFSYNMLTGAVINIKTGNPLERNKPELKQPVKEFDRELYLVKKVMSEHYQEKRLERYHTVYDEQGKEAAETAYANFSNEDYLTMTNQTNDQN